MTVKSPRFTIGIDEAGRGPIAGPVSVGVFVFLDPNAKQMFRGVKESKQLSEKKREEWFAKIERAQRASAIDFTVGFKSEKFIDRYGIAVAIRRSIDESLAKLCKRNGIKPSVAEVLLDGGIKASPIYGNQKTIIDGDAKEMVIALASICAKVLRDRKMVKLSKEYSKYGFHAHKGYGTRAHYEAITRYGILVVHRRSFLGGY